MSYSVIATEPFERKLKRLAKKYKSLRSDLTPVFEQLALQPDLGTPIGHNCYKIRISIASKGRGKSGGARMITYVRVVKSTVYLMDIYDKSEQSTISESELRYLIGLMAK
ncbi:MAG TPA: type II toxin-antitoxin system RelE/ParE family toxin [Bacteroidia bacterium]|nr:type II toxin-antitoxin system RelE/ParE family toxin [Bacteroidia bacterium]